jgi:hypothetical protein
MNERYCILCNKVKNIKYFNDEHILPQAIGSELTLNNICVKCNQYLSKYDQAVSDYFKVDRILHRVKYHRNFQVKGHVSSSNNNKIKIPIKMEFDKKSNSFKSNIYSNYYLYEGKKKIFKNKKERDNIINYVFYPKFETLDFIEQIKHLPKIKQEFTDLYKLNTHVIKGIIKSMMEYSYLILHDNILLDNFFILLREFIMTQKLKPSFNFEKVKDKIVPYKNYHQICINYISGYIVIFISYFSNHNYFCTIKSDADYREKIDNLKFNLIRINPNKPKEMYYKKASLVKKNK